MSAATHLQYIVLHMQYIVCSSLLASMGASLQVYCTFIQTSLYTAEHTQGHRPCPLACMRARQVSDFGISKLSDASESSLANANPRWIAPEIMEGQSASPACDVYSFGIVMWELLTWELPWGTSMTTWMVSETRHRERVCAVGTRQLTMPVKHPQWRSLDDMSMGRDALVSEQRNIPCFHRFIWLPTAADYWEANEGREASNSGPQQPPWPPVSWA
jgi:serine/threonine protein kinase